MVFIGFCSYPFESEKLFWKDSSFFDLELGLNRLEHAWFPLFPVLIERFDFSDEIVGESD